MKKRGMRTPGIAIGMAVFALVGCGRSNEQQAQPRPEQPANVVGNEAAPAIPPPATGPNARTPLAEPKGPIDPKSAEAAGQVVQSYGALIEQARWAEAAKRWGNPAAAAEFTAALKRYAEVHLEIGDLGPMEGAAGSIYITMPVVFYGKLENGSAFRRPADVVLRRVNDVPGSTEEQRRWHIEKIEWKNAA